MPKDAMKRISEMNIPLEVKIQLLENTIERLIERIEDLESELTMNKPL